MQSAITFPLEKISALCQRYPIRRLSVFGSVLRHDFGHASDIDILVEFEPGSHSTLFDMGSIQVELSEMLGRDVDLKTPMFLSQYFRQNVLDSAETLYERE